MRSLSIKRKENQKLNSQFHKKGIENQHLKIDEMSRACYNGIQKEQPWKRQNPAAGILRRNTALKKSGGVDCCGYNREQGHGRTAACRPHKNQKKRKGLLFYLNRDKQLYLMLIPAVVVFIIYKYFPMLGNIIAFKDFKFADGIFGSEWVGLKHFERLFTSDDFYVILKNTLVLSFYSVVFSFPMPVILALIFNEVKNKIFKKSIQSIVYIPNFISWIVLGGMVISLDGIYNAQCVLDGMSRPYGLPELWSAPIGTPLTFAYEEPVYMDRMEIVFDTSLERDFCEKEMPPVLIRDYDLIIQGEDGRKIVSVRENFKRVRSHFIGQLVTELCIIPKAAYNSEYANIFAVRFFDGEKKHDV